jgi:MFS family permease
MTAPDVTAPAPEARTGAYAWYVLALLFIVYVLNFVDRQIISILAQDIKRDLGLRDEDIGFLYGTAFGVFYALFGIPLGRLADSWHRGRLITLGLALWSAMTAVSGLVRTGGELAAARIGVGIGEATASPSAYSLISDWFPKRLRATALSIYSSGIYFGGGLSLFIGGLIVERWDRAYAAGGAPLGLAGWQAAFLAVGIPGLILALVIATLREPIRGRMDGIATPPHPAPFRAFGEELMAVIPPFTVFGAARQGTRALALNLAGAVVVTLVAYAVIRVDGPRSVPQWCSVGIGIYAVFSWATTLKRRDAATYRLIVGSPAVVATIVAYGLNALVAYGVALWAPSFAVMALGQGKAESGAILGANAAIAGFLGITLGGIMADRLRQRFAAGRLVPVLLGGVLPVPLIVAAFTATSPTLFYAALFAASVAGPIALGAAAATVQDLVLPRMRGTATAAFFIGTTLLGLALGPYMAGRISSATGSLATGVLALLAVTPLGLAAGLIAWRTVPAAEATRAERARAAGEPI